MVLPKEFIYPENRPEMSVAAVTRPLMGKSLHKTIERNQVKTAKKLPLPPPVPALVINTSRPSLLFRHMLACRRRGLIVLTDRYPHVQRDGRFPIVEGGRFVSWLASQERKAFHWMAAISPIWSSNSMSIWTWPARVNTTKRCWIEDTAITPQLTFGGAQLVDIDANQPLEKVLVDAEKAITDFMTARGYHSPKMEMPDRQDRAFSEIRCKSTAMLSSTTHQKEKSPPVK